MTPRQIAIELLIVLLGYAVALACFVTAQLAALALIGGAL